jgi:heptosyltransferase-3
VELALDVGEAPSILVVRRDNIGDLVCTTPLIVALRRRFPKSWIGVFANSYNAPILDGHPDLNEIIVYRKAKHSRDSSRIQLHVERFWILLNLRRRHLDWILLTKREDRPVARLIGAKCIAGFYKTARDKAGLDYAVPIAATRDVHHVEALYQLGGAFGINGKPPNLRISINSAERHRVDQALAPTPLATARHVVGIHIGARRISQRWPKERFVELIRRLYESGGVAFMLFWTPGSFDQPQHPGDDIAAQDMLAWLEDIPVLPWRSPHLTALVAGISSCSSMICSDGGAMHIAAALGKPIVAFFGDSDPSHWRPWGVPFRILQPATKNVGDLTVADAVAAWHSLARPRPCL